MNDTPPTPADTPDGPPAGPTLVIRNADANTYHHVDLKVSKSTNPVLLRGSLPSASLLAVDTVFIGYVRDATVPEQGWQWQHMKVQGPIVRKDGTMSERYASRLFFPDAPGNPAWVAALVDGYHPDTNLDASRPVIVPLAEPEQQ